MMKNSRPFQLPRGDPWRGRGAAASPLINVMELEEPDRCSVSFHFMPRQSSPPRNHSQMTSTTY